MRMLALVSIAAVLAAGSALSKAALTRSKQDQVPRDGRHDFDWEFGTWNTSVRVLRNPLSAERPNWVEYRGTSVVRPLVDRRFNLVELSVAGPAGRIEGASLRLYEPQSKQWSLNYANVRDGKLTAPVYGSFDGHGHGLFHAHDTVAGRPILVRFVITEMSRTEAHFEQAYSADEGQTWETNWIAVDVRGPRNGPSAGSH